VKLHDRSRTATLLGAAVFVLWWALQATAARAYSSFGDYTRSIQEGGGGGRLFTGTPADGYGCDICQVGAEGAKLQVVGLPTSGYVPGQAYEIALRWPATTPHVALMAEITDVAGRPSGTTSLVSYASWQQGEGCEESGIPAADVCRLGGAGSGCCRDLDPMRDACSFPGDRSVLWVADCGSRFARFVWTAPSAAAGDVWFSTEMVTSDLRNDALGDGVTSELVRIRPAGTPPELSSAVGSCRAVPGATTRSSALAAALFPLLLLPGRLPRRGSKRKQPVADIGVRGEMSMPRPLLFLLSAAALVLQACAANNAGGGSDLFGSAGTTGLPQAAAGGQGSAGMAGVGAGGSPAVAAGNGGGAAGIPAGGTGSMAGAPGAGSGGSAGIAAAGTGGAAGTAAGGTGGVAAGAGGMGASAAGTLTVELTTVTYGGEYAPLNYGAVWFEKEDGTFIRTAKRWAGTLHATDLVTWTEASGGWGSIFGGGNTADMMDAMSSATIRTHQMHTVTWNMMDTAGQLVPDGAYVAVLEMSESRARDRNGPVLRIPFTKGPSPQTANPPAQEGFTGVMLRYEP
jgi:hypothetical protein